MDGITKALAELRRETAIKTPDKHPELWTLFEDKQDELEQILTKIKEARQGYVQGSSLTSQ